LSFPTASIIIRAWGANRAVFLEGQGFTFTRNNKKILIKFKNGRWESIVTYYQFVPAPLQHKKGGCLRHRHKTLARFQSPWSGDDDDDDDHEEEAREGGGKGRGVAPAINSSS